MDKWQRLVGKSCYLMLATSLLVVMALVAACGPSTTSDTTDTSADTAAEAPAEESAEEPVEGEAEEPEEAEAEEAEATEEPAEEAEATEEPAEEPGAEATEAPEEVPAEDAAEESTDEADEAAMDVEPLRNGTYAGIYDEPVTLTDGLYQGEPVGEGSAARPTVTFIDKPIAYGDLDGDGVDDAAFFLSESSGGSGTFTYLAVAPSTTPEGEPYPTIWLEDRIQIISLSIADGQVTLELIVPGPSDAACCPTLRVQNTYALEDGALVEVSSEEIGNVSLDDLMGTSWTLRAFGLAEEEPVESDPPITAEFMDGGITGSSGCNSYNAQLSSEGGQQLTVGPAASTMMACPDPQMELETQYLTALQNVTQWSYYLGDLALTYIDDDGNVGALIYAPAASE